MDLYFLRETHCRNRKKAPACCKYVLARSSALVRVSVAKGNRASGHLCPSREPYGVAVSLRIRQQKGHSQCYVLFAGDPYGTRTHVTTVKGWCLNRLTNGPFVCFSCARRKLLVYYIIFCNKSQPIISPFLQKNTKKNGKDKKAFRKTRNARFYIR